MTYWSKSCGVMMDPKSMHKVTKYNLYTNFYPCQFISLVHVENSQLSKLTVLIKFLGGIFACAFVKPLLFLVIRSIQNTDKKKRLESALIQCVSGDCLSFYLLGCRLHNSRTHPQRT